MSDLRTRQEAFLGAIRDDAAPLPAGWGTRQRAGLAIYRNNYRSALIEALRTTFARTERLVGEASMRQAAAHHCIMHPPSGWTLDQVGAGFAETCAELFANDPDVAELAALEWAMGQAFTAADAAALTSEEFAQATLGFADADWAALRLEFVPSLALLETRYNLVHLWPTLAGDGTPAAPMSLAAVHRLIVWREGERPVFVIRRKAEGDALQAMHEGATFGEVCQIVLAAFGEESGVEEAGAMLARWLTDGLIAAIVQ